MKTATNYSSSRGKLLQLFGAGLGFLAIVVSLTLRTSLVADDSLLGKHPPEWKVTDWLNGQPLQLTNVHGKVVLVRWWTAPGCSYCQATAPALNEFYEEYHQRELEVLGFYHHKSDSPLKIDHVRKYSKRFGFKFPVAIDPEWQTLKSWWLDTGHREWTSVSFLIDRKGVIRHIHPGGQYVKGDPAYKE